MMDTQNSSKISEDEEVNINLSKYALYAYDINKETHKKIEGNESNLNDSNDRSFSLSVLATNLNAEQETSLRTFLSKRLCRGMLIEGPANGNVSSMEFCLDEKSSAQAVCYSSLLSKDGIASSSEGDDEFECVEPSTPQLYIVCLLTVANGILDFFRPELTSYHESLLPLLDPGLKENLIAVKEYLNDWYDASLSYICRCITLLGEDVDKMLQLALSNGTLNVSSKDEKIQTDFNKFFESCCLSDLLNCKAVDDKNTVTINLTINGDDYEMSEPDVECSEYCKVWASALIENNVGDPLILKRIVEDFRLKTIQDMNTLKRMIRQAENDHYALFRTYTFIAKSGYGTSLLQHAKQEETVNNNTGALSVITIVEEFMHDLGIA